MARAVTAASARVPARARATVAVAVEAVVSAISSLAAVDPAAINSNNGNQQLAAINSR